MRKLLALIILAAIVTRFYALTDRPMDHDESIHAYLSYVFMKSGYYRYDPAFHGPFIYITTGFLFKLFGDSELVARSLVAIFSIFGIYVAYLFRRFIGNSWVILAAVLLFSPSILYYSRYFRNDIIVIASFLAAVYFYFRYSESRKLKYAAISSLFLAIMICSKENGFIYLGTLLSFILLKRKFVFWRDVDFKAIIVSLAVFMAVVTFYYTAAFTDYYGVVRAFTVSIEHWVEMHEKKDHWKPIYYYAVILAKYEFFVLGLFFASVSDFVERIRKKLTNDIELFAAYWLFTSFLAYHVLSHKVPWLTVHLVLPMAFFSSIYSSKLVFSEDKLKKVVTLAIFTVNVALAFYVTFVDYNNTDHDLIYIQVQPSAVELAKRIQEFNGSLLVYEPSNDYWPLPWYLRHDSIPFSSRFYEGYDVVVTSERAIGDVITKGYMVEGRYEIRPGYYMVWLQKSES